MYADGLCVIWPKQNTSKRWRFVWTMQRNGAYLSEHIFQGKVIQKQFPRIHQPLVFGALNIQK